MPVVFIHPPFDASPSGGNTYNKQVIDQAKQVGYPLVSFPVLASQIEAGLLNDCGADKTDLILWDSLLVFELGAIPEVSQETQQALLLHYLPSMNPLLDKRRQSSARQKENRAISQADFLITTGQTLQQQLTNRYPEKLVRLCEPGVDPAFLKPHNDPTQSQTDGVLNLLTVANCILAKGYLDLLEILTSLRGRKWTWHWVGDDRSDAEHSKFILATADRLGLAERIQIHGILHSRALAELMSTMDIFVSASHFESYGMALAEAAAMGLPVVTTRVGESARLIRQGQTGHIVPVGNLNAFKIRLAELMDTPGRLASFKRHAREYQPRTWTQTFSDFKLACRQCL